MQLLTLNYHSSSFMSRFFCADEFSAAGIDKPVAQNNHTLKRQKGAVNYRLNALIGKGCLKVNNFRNSDNKLAYAYLLTPHGVEQKARMTVEFLQIKVQEYERLRKEIEELQCEARQKDLPVSMHDSIGAAPVKRAKT